MRKIKYKFLVLFRGQTYFNEYEVEINISKGQCITDAWLKAVRLSAIDGDVVNIAFAGEVENDSNSR